MDTDQFWASFKREDIQREGVEGPCLIWTRASHSNSTHKYGIVWYEGRYWRTHRLAWTLTNGEIPEGLKVLHACDNPPCGEVSHLRVGTQAENMADVSRRGRARAGPFTPEHAVIIRRLWATGKLSQYELASAFGVSRSHIAHIVNGRRWTQPAALHQPEGPVRLPG